MDRLRAMSGARRLFNGPLRETSRNSSSCRVSPAHRLRGAASVIAHGRCSAAAVRVFSTSGPSSSSGQIILESPFGTCKPVDSTLPDYIWRNVDKWEDKPMIVSLAWPFNVLTAETCPLPLDKRSKKMPIPLRFAHARRDRPIMYFRHGYMFTWLIRYLLLYVTHMSTWFFT